MQQLDVISVNIWQIIIALANLTILFLVLKRFLFKPVEKIFKKRHDEVEEQYNKATSANESAQNLKIEYETKLNGAKLKAEDIIKKATVTASSRSEKIVEDAREEADAIVARAKTEAELEKLRAQKDIKNEIVDVSSLLAEKILSREINENDHKQLIDSFIDRIGEQDDIDK
ncbi:MAG: F0F1 ATP synthase subunit B [Clostridia bacterium]|nr:F0F1 ATP synthase subunit B [Clostridia bacterium]